MNQILKTNARFLNLSELFKLAEQKEFTGYLELNWDSSNPLIMDWVENKIFDDQILNQNLIQIDFKDGFAVNAKLDTAEAERSLNYALQLGYGIGCSVLPELQYIMIETDPEKIQEVFKISKSDFINIITKLQNNLNE